MYLSGLFILRMGDVKQQVFPADIPTTIRKAANVKAALSRVNLSNTQPFVVLTCV